MIISVNRSNPDSWNEDTRKSVDLFNDWFMSCAPKAFRDTRERSASDVEKMLKTTGNFTDLTVETLKCNPGIIAALRMSCCPPLAVDRLIGLAGVNKSLLKKMEKEGRVSPKMSSEQLDRNLQRMLDIIVKMLDRDIFPWLSQSQSPSDEERHRSAIIIADRLCGATANPIIRNAQEKRQLEKIEGYLLKKGYQRSTVGVGQTLTDMKPGTFCFRTNIEVAQGERPVKIPVDAIIQPKQLCESQLPLLIEAKSAGDFTNTNKRQKEEATKAKQLRGKFGEDVQFVLFLCGYFNSGYLGYEAAERIDWVWEHRIDDFEKFGV